MNAEIENLLNSGREKLAEARRVNDEKENAERESMAKLNEQRRNGIMALVPDALHPYATVENNEYIHIQLPGAALLSARVHLAEDYWEGEVRFVRAELANWKRQMSGINAAWRLFRYGAHEGEVSWYEEAGELYIDMETALARAVELGSGKAEADLQACRQREDFAVVDGGNDEEPTDEGFEICPLMSRAGKQHVCLQHECAWFVAYKGMNACSLKVLANRAADGMEVE